MTRDEAAWLRQRLEGAIAACDKPLVVRAALEPGEQEV
jgi:hypothetical protein